MSPTSVLSDGSPKLDITRFDREMDQEIALGMAKTSLTLVVMGPELDKPNPASKLRGHIVQKGRSESLIIKPEHDGLEATARKRFGAGHDLTLYETGLVEKAHLVVIIPDSPGSLCELGLFTYPDKFCEKMIVFANKNYRKTGSYVSDGPLVNAKNKGARVIRIDYAELDVAWNHVFERIQTLRALQHHKNVMEGR